MMKKKEELTRADFLSLVLRGLLYLNGALVALGLLRFFGYIPPQLKPKTLVLGNAADVPPGTGKLFPEEKVFLIHSGQGWRALSLVCPHLGCIVRQQSDGGFQCPCHGSAFDSEGNRIKGPAGRSLDQLKVEIDVQGQIIVSG
jgi:cytochrome b6-f complex iron-sulfur subunit